VHEVILANGRDLSGWNWSAAILGIRRGFDLVEWWNTVARLLLACAIVLVDVDARRHVKAEL